MWVPAENFCRELGGHLVSIKDLAENDFIHRLRKSEYGMFKYRRVQRTTSGSG